MGGNGTQGDYSAGSADGTATDKIAFDVADAVAPLASGEIFFIEGNRARVGAFSNFFENANGTKYRVVSTVIDKGLKRPVDMIRYDDGVLVSDSFANQVFKITKSGVVSVFAGTGTAGASGDNVPATALQLNNPQGLATDGDGNVYVADSNNQVIRKIDRKGNASIFAGVLGSMAEAADFAGGGRTLRYPQRISADNQGRVYVLDDRKQIRRTRSDGTLELIAGTGVIEQDRNTADRTTTIGLGKIVDMKFGPDGLLYYADASNHVLRRISANGTTEVVVGSGKVDAFPYYDAKPQEATFGRPTTFGFDLAGNLVYFESTVFRWMFVPVEAAK